MRERAISVKEALNEAARIGLRGEESKRGHKFVQKTFRMGQGQQFRWDKVLAVADAVEDEELSRKLSLRISAQNDTPTPPDGEAVAGIGLVRTGDRGLFVESASRVLTAHHSAGFVPAAVAGGDSF